MNKHWRSMKTSSAKNKGRKLQQWVRDKIRRIFNLPEADVSSRSMGAAGVDILLSKDALKVFPFSVEAKNTESLNVWKAYEQATMNTLPNTYPLLVIKRNNTDPLVVVNAELFLEMAYAVGFLG